MHKEVVVFTSATMMEQLCKQVVILTSAIMIEMLGTASDVLASSSIDICYHD